LKRDLQLAQNVQRSFLPRTPPQLPGYEFFGFYEAAREVGGDYYGFIPLPGGRMAVAIGDVAGKGVAASLLMAKLSSDIRFAMLTEAEPHKSIARLNDMLYEFTSQMDRFVTVAAVVIDPATHVATMVSGGHPSPLLYRPTTGDLVAAMDKDVGGPPLGMMDGLDFDSCQITLEPGESLLLYTDGLDESMDVKGKKFELEGIDRVIKSCGRAGPKEMVERLVAAIKQHAVGRDPHDDLTVVALGRRN
jgi:serine phosphatase RsbU (regulator of sigma subunit)